MEEEEKEGGDNEGFNDERDEGDFYVGEDIKISKAAPNNIKNKSPSKKKTFNETLSTVQEEDEPEQTF